MPFIKWGKKASNKQQTNIQQQTQETTFTRPDGPLSPDFVGAFYTPASTTAASSVKSDPTPPSSVVPPAHGGAKAGHVAHGHQHSHHPRAASSLSGYTSAASEATVTGSAFSVSEHPRSPADEAASAGSARGGGSGGAAATSWAGEEQQENPKKSQYRRSRFLKSRADTASGASSTASSSCADNPVEIERKRKAKYSRAAAAMYATPGNRMVGRYEILETLGTGYSGKVKKGRDVVTGQYVALKIMRRIPEGPRAAISFRRLQEEIRAMTLCGDHPHTVGLLEHSFPEKYPKRDGSFEDVILLVMELCEKGELFDLLYRGGVVPDFVCKEYFRQLMAGIKFCHDQGVWHRDLKPENLLLDETFSLKIADFGFCSSSGNLLCNSIVGSRAYMAPEVLSRNQTGQAYRGGQADVWSAGVILFTMLAGHPPMEIAAETDWWFRALKLRRQDLFWESHQRNAREPFADAAKDLVNKMLMIEPSERITVPQILLHPYVLEHRSSWSSPLTRLSTTPHSVNIKQRVYDTMSHRQRAALAAKRTCRVSPAESSRGTASSGTSTSYTRSPRSAARAAAQGEVPATHYHGRGPSQDIDVYFKSTYRSVNPDGLPPWTEGCVAPVMSESDVAGIVGGFIASGRTTDVVEAVERALLGMGAKIPALEITGRGPIARSSFKVSATLPAAEKKDKTGGISVAIVAKIFRVVASDSDSEERVRPGLGDAAIVQSRTSRDDERAVVVLQRRGGDLYGYRKVEEALVKKMTGESEASEESDAEEVGQ